MKYLNQGLMLFSIVLLTWISPYLYGTSKGPSVVVSDDKLDFEFNPIYKGKGEIAFSNFDLAGNTTLKSGDSYKIVFTPKQDGYVYIFQQDSSGKIYPLFPIEKFKKTDLNHPKSVKKGVTYYIPSEKSWFQLDKTTGTESIYFITSKQPDTVLEEQVKTALSTGAIIPEKTLIAAKGPYEVVPDLEKVKGKDLIKQILQDCESETGCYHKLIFQHK